jgi:two-component system, NtrC family, response regulator HydG
VADAERDTLLKTGLAVAAVAARAPGRGWVVRIAGGPDAGREVALGTTPAVVGAHASCDLVLNDARVSARHLELSGALEGVRVRDLGSSNGTYWNGSRVDDAVVPVGSTLLVGKTTLKLAARASATVPPSERRAFGGLVGSSLAMREVFGVLERASPSDATILLQGESGTGKEVAARAIHDHSRRAAGPFVVVDCSALAAELAESHLFGHKKGAFTGSLADRKGAFVAAHGGTLFLDEIGELPSVLQPKLLRALEQRTVTPVGSDEPTAVNVRLVAATHRDLAAMVANEIFRFDLYHRLSVVHLVLPPLRERLEDLPELVEACYLARGVRPRNVGGDNLELLGRRAWPGNVRELRNALERAWALAADGGADGDFAALRLWLDADAEPPAPEAVEAHLPFKEAKERWLERFERRYLASVWARHGYNVTHAAEHAGINRRHFRELCEKYGIRKP